MIWKLIFILSSFAIRSAISPAQQIRYLEFKDSLEVIILIFSSSSSKLTTSELRRNSPPFDSNSSDIFFVINL